MTNDKYFLIVSDLYLKILGGIRSVEEREGFSPQLRKFHRFLSKEIPEI